MGECSGGEPLQIPLPLILSAWEGISGLKGGKEMAIEESYLLEFTGSE
jgi:hypothetical protein